MEPLRSWTLDGPHSLTIKVYKPVVTIKCGDGPEAQLSPEQVNLLSEKIVDCENFFDSDDPEML